MALVVGALVHRVLADVGVSDLHGASLPARRRGRGARTCVGVFAISFLSHREPRGGQARTRKIWAMRCRGATKAHGFEPGSIGVAVAPRLLDRGAAARAPGASRRASRRSPHKQGAEATRNRTSAGQTENERAVREKTAALMERVKTLAPVYQEWVQSVAGLMSIAELEYFVDLEQDYRRDAFMEAFWQPRDPDPTTPGNELRMRWEEFKRDSDRAAVRRSALRRLSASTVRPDATRCPTAGRPRSATRAPTSSRSGSTAAARSPTSTSSSSSRSAAPPRPTRSTGRAASCARRRARAGCPPPTCACSAPRST